ALDRAGARDVVLTSDPELLRSASKVILPGVGEASTALESLRKEGLDTLIPTLTNPVLGICIGLQLLCQASEEGNVRGMGVFPANVRRFVPGEGIKVPHMGWNSLSQLEGPLFKGIDEGTYFYFVHSYRADICEDTAAVCDHGGKFSAAICRGNFYGVQFHPEKSGAAGERVLKNFLAI
ncbi:MAG: imidazole glycerol phosphate synthase subunit HisH, partial [Bacteroidales bacterium]|nr:imidazole glycerol phosphate synthase subunit HisH [Bacteroidales bacterium]